MSAVRVLLFSLLFTVAASAEGIRVGAAISLREAVSEIAASYESQTGQRVEFTFASSGKIQAQIQVGAEIDVFISAANKQVDALVEEKLVNPASRRVVVTNRLVLVVPADAKHPPASFEGLADAGVTKVAAGEPKTVPAGQYAQQVFAAMHLTEALSDKLVYGANVRQVLNYVERGEVSAGVVYATDAMQSGKKVRVVSVAKEGTHEPIVYPGVVVTASQKPKAAKQFLDYLGAAESKAVFEAKGFSVPGIQSDRQ